MDHAENDLCSLLAKNDIADENPLVAIERPTWTGAAARRLGGKGGAAARSMQRFRVSVADLARWQGIIRVRPCFQADIRTRSVAMDLLARRCERIWTRRPDERLTVCR